MKREIDWGLIIGLLILGICLIFALICLFWSIYAYVKYGNQPITEIPAWALWFMFQGGR